MDAGDGTMRLVRVSGISVVCHWRMVERENGAIPWRSAATFIRFDRCADRFARFVPGYVDIVGIVRCLTPPYIGKY